jgi:putative endonuclease
MPYYAYIIRCADGSYYTGYTKNIENRMKLHKTGKGARYTKIHKPRKLAYAEEYASISEAMQRERKIKRLSHKQKKDLINSQKEERKSEANSLN